MGRLHPSALYRPEDFELYFLRYTRQTIPPVEEELVLDDWTLAAREIQRSDPDGSKSLSLLRLMQTHSAI